MLIRDVGSFLSVPWPRADKRARTHTSYAQTGILRQIVHPISDGSTEQSWHRQTGPREGV